jgi:hypothetical protein
MSKKLYMYRILPGYQEHSFCSNTQDGIFLSNNWPLLGLDRQVWRGQDFRKFETEISVKPFEVRQKKFDLLIATSKSMGVKLIKIEFTNDLNENEHIELINLISASKLEDILRFVEQQRYDFGNDIQSITFLVEGSNFKEHVTFTREGVLISDIDDQELSDVLSSSPIGVLTGTYLPNPEELEYGG